MKRNIYYFLLVCLFYCCSANKNNCNCIVTNQVLNDTFFLKREIKDGKLCNSIHIDSTGTSAVLSHLLGFNNTDSSNIKSYLTSLRDEKTILRKYNAANLSGEWIPVYQFRSKYYAYKPADPGSKRHKFISDSLLMFYYMDGYQPSGISSFSQRSEYVFNLTSFRDQMHHNTPKELNLYLIDPKNMLTIWEYKYGDELNFEYELMIPARHAKSFPIIVNSVKCDRQPFEFKFDEIDFKSLKTKFR